MHTTNVHMACSPPRTSSWAKKSGCDVSLVGPAVLSSLRPWGTILRPFLSDGVLAGPGTALRVRHAAGRSHRCPICQIMSACCSSLCSGRAKVARVRTGTASLISGPAVHRTGTRLWTCRAVQLTDGRSRSRRLAVGRGRPGRAARPPRRCCRQADCRILNLALALAWPTPAVRPPQAVCLVLAAGHIPMSWTRRP